MAMRVIKTGLPEMLLFSANLAFDLCPSDTYTLGQLQNGFNTEAFRGLDPKRAELYTLCERMGVGITVMKPLGGGKLISKEHTPFNEPMTVAQCIHYALTRPAVASVLPGCKTGAEVLDAVSYLDKGNGERDYAPLLGTLRNDFLGNCVYCGHCQPCPEQIDIAAVNKYLDIARLDEKNIPPSVRSHYNGLARKGEDCGGCKSCEARCPFGVKVASNMDEAARIFA
jgi:predicted aldo/keto reductase-like oxidoreductase